MISDHLYEFSATVLWIADGDPQPFGRLLAAYEHNFDLRELLAHTLLHVHSSRTDCLSELPALPEPTLDPLPDLVQQSLDLHPTHLPERSSEPRRTFESALLPGRITSEDAPRITAAMRAPPSSVPITQCERSLGPLGPGWTRPQCGPVSAGRLEPGPCTGRDAPGRGRGCPLRV